MPKIKVEVPYAISQELAITRIKGLLTKLKTDYQDMISDLNEHWTGNGSDFSFKVMGMKVQGNLNISNEMVSLNGDLPLMAMPFKKTIEDKIKEETEKLLK